MDAESRSAIMKRLSSNAAAVLESAAQEAKRRDHTLVGSEHLLWSLLVTDVGKKSRGTVWLSAKLKSDDVISELEALPWFGSSAKQGTFAKMFAKSIFAATAASTDGRFTSSSVDKILAYAAAVQQQIQEQGSTFEIATEYLLLACLLQDCVARSVLERASDGAVNGATLVKALGINEAVFSAKLQQIRSSWATPWQVVSVRADKISDGTLDAIPGEESRQAADFEYVSLADLTNTDSAVQQAALVKVTGPTKESNWMIPGMVCTGYYPDWWYGEGSGQDVAHILTAGVDTFVCFHEDPPEYTTKIQQWLQKHGTSRVVTVIHFPIDDFATTNDKDMVMMVEMLAALVQRGHNLYMHCFSGRGRTGTVHPYL
jgi:hypothetical protein